MNAATMVNRFVEAGGWQRKWPQYVYRYRPANTWCAVGILTDEEIENEDYEVFALVEEIG